jgi:NAD-dependent dihydropyrimidine dehydrogenase PreA subunit
MMSTDNTIGHSKGPAQLTSMSSDINAEQFDLTRRRKVIKNAILNGATLMLQDSKHDLHEDPELDQKMFTHAGYSGRSRSEILSDYNRVLEAYHQYGVLHKPSPDVHKAILSKLLDQVTKRERYKRLENKFGRSNIFQDLLDAIDPKMLALYEKGSFELEQLKQLEDQAKIVAYTFPGCYLHVIMHLDMPAMWQLYCGAAISVIKRVCDHMNSRYDKKTLHYFAWNQPKTEDFWLLLGGFKDLLHRYQGNDLNLMLNLFEKFHGLVHQVFAPCMLREWLPGDIDIRRPGANLNVASPLIQTYSSLGEKLQALTAAEADEIDDNFNDLAESAHPLTCAYAKFLRRKQEIHTKNLGRRLKPSEYQIMKSTAARRQRIDPAKAAHWRDADESMGDEIKVYTICTGCLKQKFRNTNQPVLEERIDLAPLYTVQGSIYVARVITCRLCNSCRLHIPTQANKPFIRMSSIAKIDSTPDDSETFDMLQILEQEDLDYETQR